MTSASTMPESPPGLLIAAPNSGSGKTLVTLALLRALRRGGTRVASLKIGPDYIDPAFHGAASGRACLNFDGWAMRAATRGGVLQRLSQDADLLIGEGVMGLFDGGPGGAGSTAEAARLTGFPVVLVVDAKGMGASAGALIEGFLRHDPGFELAGVLFNRVGGAGHARLLREAAERAGTRCLGCLPRSTDTQLPSRHLGLVQAEEHEELETLIEAAADWLTPHIDLAGLAALARPAALPEGLAPPPLPPLGQRIAVACDRAFAFCYDAVLHGWRSAGAEVRAFSPLADEAPAPDCDAVYLPGGYPELEAGRLAANRGFLDGLRRAAADGARVYGECGGYMVLGEGLVDADGRHHAMAGLLPLETSFANRRLHLGYRHAALLSDGPLGPAGRGYRGHEFHYATVVREDGPPALFRLQDAGGHAHGQAGLVRGTVAGSFVHLIDGDAAGATSIDSDDAAQQNETRGQIGAGTAPSR